jgi:hypothetical protein
MNSNNKIKISFKIVDGEIQCRQVYSQEITIDIDGYIKFDE